MSSKDRVFFPLFIDLYDQPCLVVGGGDVAQRKVVQLLRSRAKVTIISPEIIPALHELLNSNQIVWIKRKYRPPEASSYRLVIATTNDETCNKQVFSDCRNNNVPVNVVDQPDLCTFIFPSVVRRDMLTLAISSGGKAPFFTKVLRKKFEAFISEIYQLEKPELLVKFRDFIRSRTDDFSIKLKAYERLMACSKEQWVQWSEEDPPYDLWQTWIEEND